MKYVPCVAAVVTAFTLVLGILPILSWKRKATVNETQRMKILLKGNFWVKCSFLHNFYGVRLISFILIDGAAYSSYFGIQRLSKLETLAQTPLQNWKVVPVVKVLCAINTKAENL